MAAGRFKMLCLLFVHVVRAKCLPPWFIPPLDECPLSLGSLESDMTDAIDEFSDPLERDNSFAMSSNVLGVVNFSFKILLKQLNIVRVPEQQSC